jgi:flavin reductase (DIM6/NTAB) family NADH-FMN oxidoreductase RutF
MMVSIDIRTSALATILEARHFAINYLPSSAMALADSFAGKGDLRGAARFETANWTTLSTGAPVLETALGAIDCELIEAIERYRTTLVLGHVVATTCGPDATPLIHFRGAYLP